MSTLVVNYNQLNNLTSTANRLSQKLNDRINDYSNIKGKLANIATKRENLSQSNYFIDKKNRQMEGKKNKLDNFVKKVNEFKNDVVSADKRVANRIKNDTKTFKKANKIGVVQTVLNWAKIGIEKYFKSILGRDAVNAIMEKCRKVKYNLKDWYHEQGGKYIVNIALDFCLLTLSIVVLFVFPPATILAGIFSGFSIYKSVANLVFDFIALDNFTKTKNRVSADKIDTKGGKEGLEFLMGKQVGGFVYNGLTIFSIIYGIGENLKNLKATWNSFKSLDGSLLTRLTTAYREGGFTKDGFKKDGFMKSFYDIRDGGEKFSRILNVDLNSATNIANILGYYEDIKTAKDLYGNFFDIGNLTFKPISGINDTAVTFKSFVSNIGSIVGFKQVANRMPIIDKIRLIKMSISI